VNADGEILFISDLHLDRREPRTIANLVEFLTARATSARAVYILGDLFEVWLGDDDDADEFDAVFAALQQLSQTADLYFMHGNRDFLVGADLAQRLGMTLLPDPHLIELDGKPVLLMHGDLLCSDDVDYQNFRRMVRGSEWQQDFLGRPLAERKQIAAGLRDRSNQAMEAKATQIMDVNSNTVAQYFSDYRVDTLIHGHTHRPAIHQMDAGRRRIVLGDWRPEPSYLSWKQGHFKLTDSRIS
jgi:UDP-2,3-diacylglucosamine hydrolase